MSVSGRGLRVQRRQHEVPGHRRPEGDLGRLLVTDLADEDDVGVRAEHCPQAARERQPGPRVHLRLIQPVDSILDRILDRGQLAIGRVEHLQACEERRRLARSGRPDDDHRPEGL